MDRPKSHVARGIFAGGQAFCDSRGPFCTAIFTEELTDPDSAAIPLWLCPIHVHEFFLFADHMNKGTTIRCAIDNISIDNPPDSLTRVHYSITVKDPYVKVFQDLYTNQPVTTGKFVSFVPYDIVFTRMETQGAKELDV